MLEHRPIARAPGGWQSGHHGAAMNIALHFARAHIAGNRYACHHEILLTRHGATPINVNDTEHFLKQGSHCNKHNF